MNLQLGSVSDSPSSRWGEDERELAETQNLLYQLKPTVSPRWGEGSKGQTGHKAVPAHRILWGMGGVWEGALQTTHPRAENRKSRDASEGCD